jgi:hypothetical protein
MEGESERRHGAWHARRPSPRGRGRDGARRKGHVSRWVHAVSYRVASTSGPWAPAVEAMRRVATGACPS